MKSIILLILIAYDTATSLAYSPCLREGRFSNPFDCTKFYVCHFNGFKFVIHEFKCSNGFVFDQRTLKCIEPNYAQLTCGNVHLLHSPAKYSSLFYKNSEFLTKNEKPTVPIFNNWHSRNNELSSQEILDTNSENKCLKQGYFRVKNTCSKYYICFLNEENILEKYNFNCPNGLAFDEWSEMCLSHGQVKGCEDTQKSYIKDNDYNKNNGNNNYYNYNYNKELIKKANISILRRKGKEHNLTNKRRRPFKGKRPSSDSKINPLEMPFVRISTIESDKRQASINSNYSRISIKEMPSVKFLLEIENKLPNIENETFDLTNHIFTSNNETIQLIKDLLNQGANNTSQSTINRLDKDSKTESERRYVDWLKICIRPGIHKNPFDCSKFIFCAKKGLLFHFDCPESLIFDEESETCSSPNLVPACTPLQWNSNEFVKSSITSNSQIDINSEMHQEEDENNSDIDIKPSPHKCYTEGFFSDSQSCIRYFQCIRNQDYYRILYFNCSNGLVFNEKSKTCDQPDNVPSCKDAIKKETNITEDQERKKPDKESITESTTSITDFSTTSTTPVSTSISTTLSTFLSTFPLSTVLTSKKKEITLTTHKTPTTIRRSTTTKRQVILTTQRTSLTSRSTTTKKQVTLTTLRTPTPSRVPILFPSTKITPKLTTKCIQSVPIRENVFKCIKKGLFPDPNDCQVFYRCVPKSGEFSKYKFKCNSRLVFDEHLKICNFPENVKSSCKGNIKNNTERKKIVQEPVFDSSNIKPTINKNQILPKKTITKMKECNREGFFRDKSNPNKFYRCVNFGTFFKLFKFKCGSGLFFDEKYNVCNWPSNVKL